MNANDLYAGILKLHILSGFLALKSGLLIMVLPKGKYWHKLLGRLYYWSMASVFGTSLLMLALQPEKLSLWFLGGVAIVSFYQTYTGRLRLNRDFSNYQPDNRDYLSFGLQVVTGLAFLAGAAKLGWMGYTGYAILCGFFAQIAFWVCREDRYFLQGKQPPMAASAIAYHISRMMGSYAATITAFLVNAVPRHLPESTPDWVYLSLWILPGTLIGGLGVIWKRRCKKKDTNAFHTAALS
jgi:uncharacterized membrane protein